MRTHEIAVGGGRTLRVIEDGDPDGAPVIKHHGTPGSRLLHPKWVADAATRGIRLFGYDRAGYGGSDRDPGRDVAAVAADIAAVADALGIERFATWGASGGGPHALACAALLGERVVAAATVAGAAPSDAGDLDFMAGMGEDNVKEFGAAFDGEATLRPLVEAMANGMVGVTTEALVQELRTVLSPPDAAVVTGELGEFLLTSFKAGLSGGVDGWVDDDLAFVKPWGFDPATIKAPVQVWQGEQDLMVPLAHGEWLARHVPGADRRISLQDGHLTITELHMGEVHAWLLAHF